MIMITTILALQALFFFSSRCMEHQEKALLKEVINFIRKDACADLDDILTRTSIDLNQQDTHGLMPMHYAAKSNNPAIIKLLIRHGAVNIHQQAGYRSIDMSEKEIGTLPESYPSASKYVPAYLSQNAGYESIDKDEQPGMRSSYTPASSSYVSTDTIENLEEPPINPQELNAALFKAVFEGNVGLVELLIKKGALPNALDRSGNRPLHIAAISGHEKIVKLLINKDVDIHAENIEGLQAFHNAALAGHLGILKLLSRAGSNLNKPSANGGQALHHATATGHLPIIVFLIENKADMHARDNTLAQPLHLATNFGHQPIIEWLISHGADMTAEDMYGKTPLKIAIKKGNHEILACLISHGAELDLDDEILFSAIETVYPEGSLERNIVLKNSEAAMKMLRTYTPRNLSRKQTQIINQALILSAAQTIKPVLQYIINTFYTSLETDSLTHSLFCAVKNQKDDYVKLILDKAIEHMLPLSCQKAGTYLTRKLKDQSLTLESRSRCKALLKMIADGAYSLRFHHLSFLPEQIASLAPQIAAHYHANLQKSIPIEKQTEKQKILAWAVRYAIKTGNKDALAKLIADGADLTARDSQGLTPLHQAALYGSRALAELLILHAPEKNLLVNATTSDGRQALHLAARNGHDAVVELLINNGAAIHEKDKHGYQPLHHAANGLNTHIIEFLIERGARVDIQDQNGWQPLHLAARRGNENVIRCLLQHGAKINAQTTNSLRPLHLAAASGHLAAVRLLVDQGADINAKDKQKKRALDHAQQNHHLTVVKYLSSAKKQEGSGRNIFKLPFL